MSPVLPAQEDLVKVQNGFHGDSGILPAHSRSPLYGLHIVNSLQGGVQAVVGEPKLRPLRAYAPLGIATVLPVRQIERGDQGNGRKRHVMRHADGEDGIDGQQRVLQVLRAGAMREPFAEPYQLGLRLVELCLSQGRIRVAGVSHLTPVLPLKAPGRKSPVLAPALANGFRVRRPFRPARRIPRILRSF